jgi:hypothetical protein
VLHISGGSNPVSKIKSVSTVDLNVVALLCKINW